MWFSWSKILFTKGDSILFTMQGITWKSIIYMYIYIYIYIYALLTYSLTYRMYVYICIYTQMYTHTHTHTHTHIYIYIYIYDWAKNSVILMESRIGDSSLETMCCITWCNNIYMYIYICLYIYIYMLFHTW